MSDLKTKCFVASPSKSADLLMMLKEAIESAAGQNAHFNYHLWTENDISGRDLVKPILEHISNAPLFVADITFLNLNVTYELGYAIGSSKRVLLLRNRLLKGDVDLANEIGIYDTLGRFDYDSVEKLASFLAKAHDTAPTGINYPLDAVKRVFFLDTPGSSELVRHIVSAIKREFRLYRSFSDEESIRLSSSAAIENVAASSGVIIPFLGDQYSGSDIHNYRAMFVAGLAHGLDRPVIILKPTKTLAPLDIRDATSDYESPRDIDRLINAFRSEVEDAFEQLNSRPATGHGLLQRLTIGDSAAENEFTTLKSYFIPTDAFGRTLQGQADLVTGRKGSGKTALFFQLRDRLRANKDNIVVDLKPEGYQLSQLKDLVLKFLQAGSQSYLISSFWHYVILLEIVHRILETDRTRHKFDHRIAEQFQKLSSLYQDADLSSAGDFSQRLMSLTQTIAERFVSGDIKLDTLTSGDITRIIYSHDIKSLEATLAEYLKHKDEVWLLFDNLDKGWSTGGVSPEDIQILRCLIDVAKKLKREFGNRKINFHAVVFVRNDVYELLVAGTADYGKDMNVNLDWTDRRQLVELLRRRLEFGSGELRGKAFPDMWARLFGASAGATTNSIESFLDKCLMRPRNLIQLFQHCKGFAVNVGNDVVTSDDVSNALDAYSRDLVTEINREISDVFPRASKLLYDFAGEKADVSHDDLMVLAELRHFDQSATERLIDLLLYYGFLGLPEENGKSTFIYDTQYDMEILKALVRKRGRTPIYLVHPAFWPALRIRGQAANNEQSRLI
jgi:hypothetical protein